MKSTTILIGIIKRQTEILFTNLFSQIEQSDLNKLFDGLPNSRYLFHLIHSVDCCFIYPELYKAPPTDITGVDEILSVIDQNRPDFIQGDTVNITHEHLKNYAEYVHNKIEQYLETLTDDMLSEIVGMSEPYTRLDLILAQYRHIMFHIGVSTAVTVNAGKPWPEYTGYEWVTKSIKS